MKYTSSQLEVPIWAESSGRNHNLQLPTGWHSIAQPGLAAQDLSSGAIYNTCRSMVPGVDQWVSQWKTRKGWLPVLVACWHEKCGAEYHLPFYWETYKGQSTLEHRFLFLRAEATKNRNIDLLKQICLNQLAKKARLKNKQTNNQKPRKSLPMQILHMHSPKVFFFSVSNILFYVYECFTYL